MGIFHKDTAAGLLFMAIGLFFAGSSFLHLRMGEATSMGPGYFPFLLGSILLALGLAILIIGMRKGGEPLDAVNWRLGLIIGAIVVFGLTVRTLGFAPSLALATLMSVRASREMDWPGSLVLTAVLTVSSVLVFVYALGLPYHLLGTWFRG